MTKTQKAYIALSVLVALVLGFTLGVYGDRVATSGGGIKGVTYDVTHLVADVYQGGLASAEVLVFHNGVMTANTSSSVSSVSAATVQTLSIKGGNPFLNMTTGTSTIATTTLGAFGNSTSTATTTVDITVEAGTASGWVAGDVCITTLTGAPAGGGFRATGYISSVATTTMSSTITMTNYNGSALTIASGTFKKVRCFQ